MSFRKMLKDKRYGGYNMYRAFVKRLLDLFLSIICIVFLTPVFITLSVVLFIDDPGQIFFTQKRVGAKKTHFSIIKFRTMKRGAPPNVPTHLLRSPEKYITRIGSFLRKSSLDELPQLINILKGDMSFVGPRPALWNQNDLVAERDKYGTNDLRPGLTGWAQINGRDELSVFEKARLDGEYVARLNFRFDCFCFAKTFLHMFKRQGIREGSATQNESNDATQVIEQKS